MALTNKLGRWGWALPVGGLLLGGLGTALYRAYLTRQTAKQNHWPPQNGTRYLHKLCLGGQEQWISVLTHNPENPVLLFLHGGPGLSLMPFAHANPRLMEHFTVVHWDQRGAGKSYHPGIPAQHMTMDQLAGDALELVDWLRTRFGQTKIYLAGHSLGSVLGLRLAARHPERFYAYIGLGQIVNKTENERISYHFALNQASWEWHHRAVRELQNLEGLYLTDYRKMVTERKWVQYYGGNLYGQRNSNRLIRLAFASPLYRWRDLWRYVQGLRFSLQHLWPQTLGINLFEEIPQVTVPVYFFEGRHDYVAPARVLEDYVAHLEAPQGKTLFWFDHSAHWPQLEEPRHFETLMIDRVLAETGSPQLVIPTKVGIQESGSPPSRGRQV